jgi:hypothetical protein
VTRVTRLRLENRFIALKNLRQHCVCHHNRRIAPRLLGMRPWAAYLFGGLCVRCLTAAYASSMNNPSTWENVAAPSAWHYAATLAGPVVNICRSAYCQSRQTSRPEVANHDEAPVDVIDNSRSALRDRGVSVRLLVCSDIEFSRERSGGTRGRRGTGRFGGRDSATG